MISEIELKRLTAYQETDPDKLREMFLAEIQAHQETKEELEFKVELLTEEKEELEKDCDIHFQTVQNRESDVRFWRGRAERGEGPYEPEFGYSWDGCGLVITRLSDGADCYDQGEEAAELYDTLEDCTEEYRVDLLLSEYDVLMDSDN